MIVLVCGGRDFTNRHYMFKVLDNLHDTTPIAFLIEGGARGADFFARHWAIEREVRYKTYPADWGKYGGDAGPIRNLQMLEEGKPDLVIAFPGGPGTRHMVDIARRKGFNVTEIEPHG
jgi:YspA, cpYpsA-related SLOG family